MSNYENRYIAFIDILGFKNLVNETVLNKETYKRVKTVINNISNVQKENYEGLFSQDRLDKEVTVFSDSIVISYSNEIHEGFFYILMDLVYICFDLILNGIYIRGGITYGELYHQKNECFGPAMIKAYMLESHSAIYPRIVVDECAIEQSKIFNGDENNKIIESLLCQDKMENFYLDFLSQNQELDEQCDYLIYMKTIKKYTIYNLYQCRSNKKIFKKYKWFAEYYNMTIRKKFKRSCIKNSNLLISQNYLKANTININDAEEIPIFILAEQLLCFIGTYDFISAFPKKITHLIGMFILESKNINYSDNGFEEIKNDSLLAIKQLYKMIRKYCKKINVKTYRMKRIEPDGEITNEDFDKVAQKMAKARKNAYNKILLFQKCKKHFI